jgi:hypothetical protein
MIGGGGPPGKALSSLPDDDVTRRSGAGGARVGGGTLLAMAEAAAADEVVDDERAMAEEPPGRGEKLPGARLDGCILCIVDGQELEELSRLQTSRGAATSSSGEQPSEREGQADSGTVVESEAKRKGRWFRS